MKADQMQQAQHLYFQTDLSKTEIAQNIGMSRRTLHHWIRQYNWDKLKKSAEYIPAFLAENCYQVLGNFTEHLLSEARKDKPVTPQEVNAIYKLGLTISKLKTRCTVNENMETFTRLTEHIYSQDPKLALALQPHMHDYITTQVAHNKAQYRPAKMEQHGYIPNPDTEKLNNEAKLDEEDLRFWAEQQKADAVASPSPSDRAGERSTSPAPLRGEGRGEVPCATPPPAALPHSAPALTSAPAAPLEALRNVESILKPKQSIRDMIRHTSTTGPAKAYNKKRLAAA